ncbi:hypothetical protein BJV77DRAFT_1039102 [Russula vinacea]|nr:hypothetical protein BJV77DRAFT_1039102 [Russula vinacea]
MEAVIWLRGLVSVWMLGLTSTKSVRKPLHVSSHVLYLRGQDNCERAYSGHKAVIRHFHGGRMDLQLGGNLKHKSIRSLISVIDLRLAFPPVPGSFNKVFLE